MAVLVKSIEGRGPLFAYPESKQLRSGYLVLAPGEAVGEHSTGGGEELIIVLEGTAKVHAGRETKTVHAPSVVLVPPRTLHNVANGSKLPLRYVYAYVTALDPVPTKP